MQPSGTSYSLLGIDEADGDLDRRSATVKLHVLDGCCLAVKAPADKSRRPARDFVVKVAVGASTTEGREVDKMFDPQLVAPRIHLGPYFQELLVCFTQNAEQHVLFLSRVR